MNDLETSKEIELGTNMVEIIDVWEDLEVYHAVDCNDYSPDNIKEARGLIKTSEGKVVCKSFPYTSEITTNNKELIDKIVVPFVEMKAKAYVSYEGTILRVWNYKDNWWISTHRRIDAFKSRWGSDFSYGTLFVQTLYKQRFEVPRLSEISSEETVASKFYEGLDKTKVYLFLLRNDRKNRIVCSEFDFQAIFTVGAFQQDSEGEWRYIEGENLKDEVGFGTAPEVQYNSLEDLLNKVNEANIESNQGAVLIKDGKSVKILNPEYERLSKIRNNEPSILIAYIKSKKTNTTEELLNLYPEMKEEITEFEKILENIVQNMFKKYVNRYVYKRVSILPPDQYRLVNLVHNEYLATKKQSSQKGVKVTLETIRKTFYEQNPVLLLNMFRSYKRREIEFGNGNWVSEELKNKILSSYK